MAEPTHEATATWQDDEFARAWAQQDSMRKMLNFPRRIAAAIVAEDNPGLGLMVDIGSGPGDFLAVFLEEFQSARGLWDHTGADNAWNARLRSARKRFRAASESGPKHHHNYPLPSVQDHLDDYAAAGIADVQVVWQAFYTCLFMGRRSV